MHLMLHQRWPHLLLLGLFVLGLQSLYGASDPFRSFLKKHCFECHDSDVKKGDLDLIPQTLRALRAG